MRQLQIKEIMVLKNGAEITIKGTQYNDNLSFPTHHFISATQLNKIINFLQEKNINTEISSTFQSFTDDEGLKVLFLNTSDLTIKNIPLSLFSDEEIFKAIRA